MLIRTNTIDVLCVFFQTPWKLTKTLLLPCVLIVLVAVVFYVSMAETSHEKTNNSGFRPCPTQTGLCSYRQRLEA